MDNHGACNHQNAGYCTECELRRELTEYREAAILVVGNSRPSRPSEHARRAEGERRLIDLIRKNPG